MNKREAQRLRRQQKQQAAAQRSRNLALVAKVGLYGVLPLLILWLLYSTLSRPPTYSTVELVASDHVRGSRSNPVGIVVYADFQCPACAIEHETMSRLWPDIQDRAYLVFRHYPISAAHRHTWQASLYAEAAARQESFWEMHDMLLANQALWAAAGDATEEFDSYALQLNLDLQRLHADIESDEIAQKVRDDQRSGNTAGVRATPALFVNDERLAGFDAARILEAVNNAYTEANAAAAEAAAESAAPRDSN